MKEKYWTIEQAMEYTGFKSGKIYSLIYTGKMKAKYTGKGDSYCLKKEWIEDCLETINPTFRKELEKFYSEVYTPKDMAQLLSRSSEKPMKYTSFMSNEMPKIPEDQIRKFGVKVGVYRVWMNKRLKEYHEGLRKSIL